MTTITHDEYLALNSVQRDGSKHQSEIEKIDLLKRNRWIDRCGPTKWELSGEVKYWRLSSKGLLEHNLYEKIHRYSDGYLRKKPEGACPRCQGQDDGCLICCGYGVRA